MAIAGQDEHPVVGRWYRDPTERRFEVASVDEEAGLIQVRYEDGEAAELSLADWRHAMVERDAMLDKLATTSDDDRDR